MKINIKLGPCSYGTCYTAYAYCSGCGRLIKKLPLSYEKNGVSYTESDAKKAVEDYLHKEAVNYCYHCGSNLANVNDSDEIFTEAEGTEYFRIKGNKTVYSLHPLKRQRVACALAKLYRLEHSQNRSGITET